MSVLPAQPRAQTTRAWEPADPMRPAARLPQHGYGPQSLDETVIGIALTTRWMLTTGRRLDQAPLMHDLTDDQLIDFWADDHGNEAISAHLTQGKLMCIHS